ncbi:hypothetical protein F5Y19DRAFT_398308 [Xylariaceae sp. FL1651]|nr:hypothetical protein F5Y19DRAFT_398308 [Xylariaceae sp. FL1651]
MILPVQPHFLVFLIRQDLVFLFLTLNSNGKMSTTRPSISSRGTNLGSAKQRRHRHTLTEWESRRERIIQLYVREGKTADEVVETLKSVFNFSTGRRQLYKKLDEWGVRKNYKLNREDTSTPQSGGQDDIVQAVSLTPLVQLSGTSTTQPTPATSRTIESQSLPSAFVQADVSPARNRSQPDSVVLEANKFGATGNLPDNVINPLQLAVRSKFPNNCSATMGREPADLSPSHLPLAESLAVSRPPRDVTLMPASNPNDVYSETALRLEKSLDQVLSLISEKLGYINHSSALQLKKSVETLLLLSQRVAEESESDITGFQRHHHNSLGESLNMTKSLIALSSSVNVNTYTSVDVPYQILPSRVVWNRRRKALRLGATTLTVTEKKSRNFANGFDQDTEAQMAGWHFGAKLVFKPEKLNNILQIQVQQYQVSFGSISLPPKIVVNNIVRNDSIVFKIAEKGSVEELQRLFTTGEACLRDCDEKGASLLYYASRGWNAPVCEYLIQNGFDVDEVILIDSNGCETTPLHLSLGQDNLETSRALLTAGADPTMKVTISSCRRASVLDKLSNNMGSPSRNLPVYAIVPYIFNLASHFDIGRYLIDGYRPVLHNLCNAGNMPSWLSVGPEEWVKFFLDRGCRTDDRSSIGTCLHVFFRSQIHRPSELGWQKALIYLVNCGANVSSVDRWDKTVSEIAFAKLVCPELNNYDLGSYRGDLWDSVLHACNYNIADFRGNCPRVARYTDHYTREDFEKLWEGRESFCPYFCDGTLPTPIQDHNLEGPYATSEMVLCTCTDEGPTCWLRPDDKNTNCRNIREYQGLNRHV